MLIQPVIKHSFKRRALLPDESDFFWQIECGIVRSMTWNDEAEIITLGIWSEGDIVGSIISAMNPYEIECLTPVTARLMPKDRLRYMSDALLQHIKHTEEFIKIVRAKHTELSILRLLHWLAHRFGQAGAEGHTIEMLLTHQEIAEIIGTTRVTATRIMGNLIDRGIVQRQDRHFVISLDRDPFWHYEI
jgi:CRP-like cAMP-binding protein